MAAPLSLPRLRRGENRFVYSDSQDGPHEITITHEWRECHQLTPPPPPATVGVSAPPGRRSATRSSPSSGPPSARRAGYHLQVSRREDFRIPYRPAYDVVIPRPTVVRALHRHVRAGHDRITGACALRDRWGVWSEWSPAWTFRWEGPRVPLNVRIETRDDGMLLRWEPNPRGTRPVAYDVYGSDEKGFSVHKEAYDSYTRGTVPANFLGRTTEHGDARRLADAVPSRT